MSEYFIQDETMKIISDNVKRIAETTDELSGAKITEFFSRIQGTVKTDGEYEVEAVNLGGVAVKSGMYDTGEIFALPPNNLFDIATYITQPDGSEELVILAKFDSWVSTSQITNNYIKVKNSDIKVGPIYKPVNDDLMFVVNIENANTTITLHMNYTNGIINWGDGTETSLTNDVNWYISHTYSNVGKYLIKIPKVDGAFINLVNSIGYDTVSTNSIIIACIPSWVCENGNFFNAISTLPNLISLIISNGVYCKHGNYHIGFYSNSSLESITLPNSMKECVVSVSGCSSLKNIVLPYGITDISGFQNCTSLTNIIIPETVASISESAFVSSGIKYITIPDSVVSIGEWAFSGCLSLTTVNVGKGVTTIEAGTFYGCKCLETIILPSVTSIGKEAFYNAFSAASNITFVLGANTICELGDNNDLLLVTNIYVPDNLVSSYKADTNWSKYSNRIKPLSEYKGTI